MQGFFGARARISYALLSWAAVGLEAAPLDDLDAWLKLDRKTRPALETQAFASAPLSAAECAQARSLIWAERTAFVKAEWGSQWTGKKLLGPGASQMPFDYRIRGPKPAAGYDLYISMHGGGGAPKEVNDQQWDNQILLYSPAGIYLAPRAPTDTWNMWHQGHIDGFFDQIIQGCVAFLDANPNRVYVMGYSAGGDGAYHMAPRMADRWAAAAMMAGYPNNASPINLRNIGFAIHVGANDAAYGRNTIAVTFGKEIQKLQDADPGFYKYYVKVHAGKGHWMDREDTVALSWMDDFTRKPHPKKVVWLQDTTVGTNSFPSGPIVPVRGSPTQYQFHWIGLQEKKPRFPQPRITAEIKGQEVHIQESNIDSLFVLLNDSLVNLDQPISVFWKGVKIYEAKPARTAGNLYRSVQDRGDREFSYPVRLALNKSDKLAVRPWADQASSMRLRKTGTSWVLEFGAAPRSGVVSVSDLKGRVRYRAEVGGKTSIALPIDALPQGLHVVSLTSGPRVFTQTLLVD